MRGAHSLAYLIGMSRSLRAVRLVSGLPHNVFTACFREDVYMKIRKKLFADFEYEEVLDTRTRELIRVGCAVAVGCPT